MAKLFSVTLLKNKQGQSAVEYIMLLAVISSLGYTFYNNKRFQSFIKGQDGLFKTMKIGMEYSYRYGLEYKKDNSNISGFEYGDRTHDTYFSVEKNKSHFFSGAGAYPNE